MNDHVERARMLLAQDRHDLAEPELRQALAQDPGDPTSHALLALSLSERERFDEAEGEARAAVAHGPDLPFAHHAMARVLFDRRRHGEALESVREAIRLDVEDPDHHSLKAAIHIAQDDWKSALSAANDGLAFDPEHPGCLNTRSFALVRLGRRADAAATLDDALRHSPESSTTHANVGWACLHRGDPGKAMEHFREALRLDPTNDWARRGIIEAIKAKNPVYALVLRYFLFTERLGNRLGFFFVVGVYLGYRILLGATRAIPALEALSLPLMVAYGALVLTTWLARPLSNLALRLHPFGRLALSREERLAAHCVGSTVLLALVSVVGLLATGSDYALLATVIFALMMIPVAAIFSSQEGWPRRLMAIYTGVLVLLGFLILSEPFVTLIPDALRRGLGGDMMVVYCLGAGLSSWAGVLFATIVPRR